MGKETDNTIENHDRMILRELALRYAELCGSERNRAALGRWRDLNNMRAKRPLVFSNTFQLALDIEPHLPEQLIENEPLRAVERWFQRALWNATLGDDRYFDPWFTVRATLLQPEGVWGIKPRLVQDETSRGWRHLPAVTKMEDLDALKATPHRVLDPDPPLARMLEEIFGDILPVHRNRVSIYHIWDGVIGPAAGALFGLEELLLAFYEQPEMVHRFMAFASGNIIRNFKECEAAGDWSTADYWYYNTPPHCDALPEPRAGVYGAPMKDLVGFCHSQECEAVSPAMFEEFLLNYQRPILELFGRVSYGCCDTLDHKLDALSQIRNLSKITVGPLADPSRYPARFGKRAVISWRPNPSLMARDCFSEEAQRRQIREGFEALRGCQVEVHLHDLMTVRNDVSRIFKWTKIAREEAERMG
jgi:hypothetical protein